MQKNLETAGEKIPYTLTRKPVKNLNLRVRTDGSVAVSAPLHMPMYEIERFLGQKEGWIMKHRSRMLAKPPVPHAGFNKEECLAMFQPVSESFYPLFADLLDGQRPVLRVREMKSRWGVCHVSARIITLNSRLAEKPIEAIEYVILHEYVHFLHPNHQAGFHAEMARLMPDYRERRKLL